MALTQHQIQRLDELVSCPFQPNHDRFPLGARQLIHECWVTLLHKHLPEPMAANLLMSGSEACGSIYEDPGPGDDQLGEPPAFCNPVDVETMTEAEFKTLESWLLGSRHDLQSKQGDVLDRVRDDVGYGSAPDTIHAAAKPRALYGVWLDDEFERMTGWLKRLRLADADVRKKHWPPASAATLEQLLAFSTGAKVNDIGWFFRGTDETQFPINALAVLSGHFYRQLRERTEADFISDRVDEFLQLWTELFENGTFRLGVDHKTVTGAWNGEKVRGMVYDFDPSASQFHCFPVKSMPQVRGCFLEGQLDF